jgi:CMP-N,N'-diacetyllegionaminic acid synthase
MRTVVMIPARIGSKRLPKKNIALFLGRPMISYSIQASLSANLVDEVYVSTESSEIAEIASSYGAKIFIRPSELAEDNVPTQKVMQNFLDNHPDVDVLVTIQANSPNVRPETIDKAIRLLVEHNLWEVRSVNDEGLENGAIWVTTRKAAYWDGLSVYFGVVRDNSVDIHTIEDLRVAERMQYDGKVD